MKYPVFELFYDPQAAEFLKLSLVKTPAIERNFLAFNEQKEFSFSIIDSDKHEVYGPVLRPDFLIYRHDDEIGEYFIKFSKETIAEIQAAFLANSKFNLDHSIPTDKFVVLESFLIDKENGICPTIFDGIEDGSWIVKLKCIDEDLWQEIKSGEFKGFSLESIFEFKEIKLENQKMNIQKIRLQLAKLLLKLGTANAVKDEVTYVFEYEGQELENGKEVFVVSEQGDLEHPEDGEYIIGEEKWEVRDGVVRKIEEIVEEKEEETRVENLEEEVVKEETEEIKEETEKPDLQAEIEEINKRLDEISDLISNFMEVTTSINSRIEDLETKFSNVRTQAPEKLEKQEIKEAKDENPYAFLKKK